MICLDVMGGDFFPQIPIKAAMIAVNDHKISVLLTGKKDLIEKELKKYTYDRKLVSIQHAEQNVEMSDSIIQALKKKDSSLYQSFRLHKDKKVEGVVSAGNSAAFLALGKSILKTLPNVDRPCISAVMPNYKGKMLLLDAGANVDCTTNHLFQFSILGSVYANVFLEMEEPRVALLNIGEEPGKGNELSRKTYKMLKEAPINFIGNIEGKDIFKGNADVIVTDGFAGNILLKTAEGAASFIQKITKKQLFSSFRSKLGSLILKKDFMYLKKRIDYAENGGAPLLGLNGVAIVCHGSSKSEAIVFAIRYAKWANDTKYVEKVLEKLSKISFTNNNE